MFFDISITKIRRERENEGDGYTPTWFSGPRPEVLPGDLLNESGNIEFWKLM